MGQGNKNEQVFHHTCLTYLIKFYDDERQVAGKQPVPNNIFQTNNCLIQYTYQHDFLKVSLSVSRHNNNSIITHKFAQKYRFKGSWDTNRELVKSQMFNNEMKYVHYANGLDCYHKLTRDLKKDGTKK